MKSLYIIFPEKGKVEVCEETLSPPGPGEVLCAAEKSLISIGTESYCLRGVFDPGTNWAEWVQYPFRPGYSMVARVMAIGKGVSGVKEGDRVTAWVEHQQFFKVKTHELNMIPNGIGPIPDGVNDEDATWAVLACTTQLGVRRAELKLGETVGVVGLGMLGQLVVQYLLVAGARRVIAIDPVQSRLEVAQAHGATHTLSMDAASARQEIEKITGGKMLDVVFDVTGHPPALAPSLQLLRRLGRLILVGDTPTPSEQCLGPGVVSNSLAILGIHSFMSPVQATEFTPWTAQEIVTLFFDYLMQGRMRVSDLITHRYSPLDAPQVYEQLARDRSAMIGVIFDWNLL